VSPNCHQAPFDLLVPRDHASFEPIVVFNEQNLFVNRLRASMRGFWSN